HQKSLCRHGDRGARGFPPPHGAGGLREHRPDLDRSLPRAHLLVQPVAEDIMKTLTGLFDDYADAAQAVRSLEAAGFDSDDISLVVSTYDDTVGEADPADRI